MSGVNAYAGETRVEIGGQSFELKFTWDALARLEAEFGEDYNNVVRRRVFAGNTRVIATALEIGSGGRITPQLIEAASPPTAEMAIGIGTALNRAFLGPKLLAEVAEQTDEAADDTQKKTLSGAPLSLHSSVD